MNGPGLSAEKPAGRAAALPGAGILQSAARALDACVSPLLSLLLTKPISIFVWWLYAGANRTTFHGRAELARRVRRARRAGDPVLFASNHVSMFDDPVVPMTLFRTGPRAAAELSGLAVLLILWWAIPPTVVPAEVLAGSAAAYAAVIALWGARKSWWSIGDLVNFSGAAALRGKLESGRERPLSAAVRLSLAVADPMIFLFMRSATVRTVLVDRRAGGEGRRSRLRAIESAIELAARGEQIWVFFEGGRSRRPDEVRPARAGIGEVVKGVGARGVRPVVIAVHHRGLEHVIPISSRRWLTSGHRIDIRWSELNLEGDGARGVTARDPQEMADEIRAAVLRLQSVWRSDLPTGG